MLTGSRLVPGIVKTYVYYSISEMIDFCGHVAKHAQTGTIFFSEIKPGLKFQNFRA